MNAKILISLLCLFTVLLGKSQSIQTTIFSDTAQVSLLRVVPDSFPSLSMLFVAKDKLGFPVWGITKDQIKVSENAKACNILSLVQVTEKLPINLSIIIDHSSSMISDFYSQLNSFTLYYYREELKRKSPLTNAKKAINYFLSEFNKPEDNAMIVGFSTDVDMVSEFTNDKSKLKGNINKLEEEGKTAFYDAINVGLDSLSDKKGMNVIVALTDGHDNSSNQTVQDIIKKSRVLDIPVYIVGLGEIKKNILESISDASGGEFFYTKESTSLTEIYDIVAKHIKSIYEVKYKSENLDHQIATREVTLEFNIDTLFLSTYNTKYDLPYSYIQDRIKREKVIRSGLIGMGIIVLIAGGGAYLWYRSRKRKDIQTT
jgi:VWFA-related protein